ncbi:MAG TPA: flagellar motor protein MotB [Bryobacteraceae bacterium]|nr:flagellar motor protein MotB [Bryobacteraceae bacterium]
MAKRKGGQAHENHERWLVSYADFITLLFAFFVVMFASSQTDKSRAKQISEAVEKALEQGKTVGVPPQVAKILGGTVDDKGQGNAQMRGPGGAQRAAKEAPPDDVVELIPSLKVLNATLQQEIKAGKVEVSLQPRGLVVSLKQTAFFPSGTDAIDPATYSILEKVAEALNSVKNPLRIEGHTDSVPIHTARFRSNWELSAARAISMMELLATHFHLDPTRVAIVGFADNEPEAPNDTPEGRAKNRRVDIVIMNQLALRKIDTKK